MVLEGIIGSLIGGVFRVAPEMLKFFDRKSERQHELDLLSANMEWERLRGDISLEHGHQGLQAHELDAMAVALKEQGQTARKAGSFVAAASALVRPLVTYWFVAFYSLVKIATMVVAFDTGANWKEILITCWDAHDMGILSMILTFWFVGRIWESKIHK